MPYMEPDVLLWTSKPPSSNIPDLRREEVSAVAELAEVWDARGLLYINPEVPDPALVPACIRVFNCYKNIEIDRQITDKRGRNYMEGRLAGDSQGLPSGPMFAVLEVNPRLERLSINCSDRKDFYHQFKVTRQRAATNQCWPPVGVGAVKDLKAYGLLHDELRSPAKRRPRKRLLVPDKVMVCFNTIGQGDHVGVEFATGAHCRLLQDEGLLSARTDLVSTRPFGGTKLLEGLVIDDYFSVSIEPVGLESEERAGVKSLAQATEAYQRHNILGSPQKDVRDADVAKVIGAELDSSEKVRSFGICSLGAPRVKRLALAYVSLKVASLPCTSDALLTCLTGGWTSAAMYRRPFMSVLFDIYKSFDFASVDPEEPRVRPLSRSTAQELVMLAILQPLMMTNLAADILPRVFASDSSDGKGAYVSAEASVQEARALWGRGSKKGGYSRLLSKHEVLMQRLDRDYEPRVEFLARDEPERPIAFRFHFIEVCGGAGKVTSEMARLGWNCGPVLDLDRQVRIL